MAQKNKYTVDELADKLADAIRGKSMECELLQTYYTRELYKQLGAPTEEDFPSEFRHARYWDKFPGWTKNIEMHDKGWMEGENNDRTAWFIQRASMTKVNIVEDYTRDGWHCEVHAYNVLCTKYVQHPKHKNIWVKFYSTRDVSRYAYVVLDKGDNE